jgi:hypothetical protein
MLFPSSAPRNGVQQNGGLTKMDSPPPWILMYLRNIEITSMKLVWYLKISSETFYNMLKDADVIPHFGLTVVCM